jgi:hypothetical protein
VRLNVVSNFVLHVTTAFFKDARRIIEHVTGYLEMMLSTRNMLKKSLDTQRRWHMAFNVSFLDTVPACGRF